MRLRFDNVIVVDWSARSAPAPPRPTRDAIWWCVHGRPPRYERTRQDFEEQFTQVLFETKGRILAGFDFSFSYPQWFLRALRLDWRGLWALLDREIEDGPASNNRFAVAASLNRRATGEAAPFWGAPRAQAFLQTTRPVRRPGQPDLRQCELEMRPKPKSGFQLWGAGSVGSQTLLGIPVLERLRRRFGDELSVWPFEARAARIVLAEVYPSCLPKALWSGHPVPDREQVRHLAAAFARGGAFTSAVSPSGEGGILLPPSPLS